MVLGTNLKKAVGMIVMTGLLSLQVNAATITVKTDALNVRQQPSTNSQVIGVVYNGEKLELLDNNGEWATVKYNNNTAYVAQQYISIDGAAAQKKLYVTASNLNIRSGAGTGFSVLTQAPYGSELTLVETTSASWYKVTYNGVTGFVSADYVRSERITGNTTSRSGVRTSASDNASLIEFAKKYLGLPYRYGGSTPSGFDCSGFVQYVFSNFGVRLSRTTYTQVYEGVHIPKENLQMGDLVFFGSAGNVNHVGIYISDGNFIHSSNTGDVVKISSLYSGHYAKTYYTARRVR